MKAVFWDNPLLPDRWKSTALQSVSVIDCWCEIVPTSKMVRAATNTADNHEKTALCARPQEMKIQQYGGSGCAPFCNGHTWAKVQITDLLTRTSWLGWSPRHVKCRSACKLDSPNYHINDVSSFIRLRACISNSFAHAWRSQEKAITPFGLEFYFKFQSKWACLVTLTELVETPEFILLIYYIHSYIYIYIYIV